MTVKRIFQIGDLEVFEIRAYPRPLCPEGKMTPAAWRVIDEWAEKATQEKMRHRQEKLEGESL